MWWFLGGILLLGAGYFTYGRLVEKIIGPDDRATPAKQHPDGVDYIVLPNWKNMLIQLLNIAGVGPVIGVILGIKFGTIVFLIIPIGNIIGGAVHDFTAGMMSIRHNGANLPKLVEITLGKRTSHIFSVFMTFLLLLVVTVFVNVPSKLFDQIFPHQKLFWVAVVIIFVYYICATLFPVDKIIGAVYPFFGLVLLIGTFAVFFSLVKEGFHHPELLCESAAFKAGMIQQPVIPALFVTIACGILSGFHATQAPIIARTMATERHGRCNFYGMMIVEGIIAMIWAAGGLAIYNLFPELMKVNPNTVLCRITSHFLGEWMGIITVIAVIILAVTSGDTAMRSMRLSLAEIFGIDQKKTRNRVLLCLPLIVVLTFLLWWSNISAKTFGFLWNYFAWGNQVLAVFTLFAASVWLFMQKKNCTVTMVPGIFMMFIVTSFLLWTSPAHGGPWGFGMSLQNAYSFAGNITVLAAVLVLYRGIVMRNQKGNPLK